MAGIEKSRTHVAWLGLVGVLAFGAPAAVAESHVVGDVALGYLNGDYGTDFDTDLYSVTTRVRWLFPKLEVRVSLPYLQVDSEGPVSIVGGSPVRDTDRLGLPGLPGLPGGSGSGSSSTQNAETSVSGMGDAKIRGELQVLQNSAGPLVNVVAEIKAPTAGEEDGLGTGETDYTGGMALVMPLGRTSVLFDANYTKMGDPEGYDFDDVTTLGGGVAWKLGDGDRRSLFLYAENRTSPIPDQDDRRDAALGLSTLLGSNDAVRLSASVLFGLSDTSEDFGVSFGVGRTF